MRLLLAVVTLLATLWSSAFAQNYVFGPNVRVNDDLPGSSFHATYAPGQHLIAARGDTVYLVWRDDRAADSHVYFARSNDGGLTFLPDVRVDGSVAGGVPSLAVDDSGDIHVCWLNCNTSGIGGRFVHYTKSTDGGRTFLPSVLACDSLGSDGYGLPSLAVSSDGRRIYVANDHGFRIRLSRSTDGGATFVSPSTVVQSDSSISTAYPAVALFEDTSVFVAWTDYPGTPNNVDTYFARSTDGGVSFGPTILLNDTTGNTDNQGDPSVGVDSLGRVYVVFTNFAPPLYKLGLVTSIDTGRTFDRGRAVLTWGEYPSLWVAPGGQLYVSWTTTFGGWDWVRFACSPDGGATFLAPVNPSDDARDSLRQRVVTVTSNREGRVFAAWSDGRNDIGGFNYDIYFAAASMSAIGEPTTWTTQRLFCTVSPVPARGSARVTFSLDRTEPVRIEILDVSGRSVAELRDGTAGPGLHTSIWNGRNRNGVPVESGIYYARIQTSAGSVSRKLILLQE